MAIRIIEKTQFLNVRSEKLAGNIFQLLIMC